MCYCYKKRRRVWLRGARLINVESIREGMYCTVRALLHSTHLLRSLPLVFPRVTASTVVSVSQDGKRISLSVDGEPERRYHGVWLRHNCRCPQCLNVTSNQNIVHHSELMDLSIKEATVNDGGKCKGGQRQSEVTVSLSQTHPPYPEVRRVGLATRD